MIRVAKLQLEVHVERLLISLRLTATGSDTLVSEPREHDQLLVEGESTRKYTLPGVT
jgi:hypothetical protein